MLRFTGLFAVVITATACSSTPVPPIATSASTASIPPSTATPGGSTPSALPSPTPAAFPGPSQSSTATPAIEFDDGTHRVPEDVPPGTYMTLTETPNCYWTRLRGFDSGLDDIIASRIGSGHQVVTIEARDAAIDSVDCGTWTSDLAGVVLERGEFSAGTYVVGLHVEPATYVATVADQCEWARLSGFGGTRREVIERGSARRGVPPFVTIEPRDLGFTSDGCGTWERQAP